MYFPLIDFSLMWTSLPFVLQGLVYTLGIGFVSFLLGNLVGLLLTVLGLLDWLPLNVFIRFYLSFFRGIPALVLLFLLYFGLPYQLSALTASVICFTITSSAFIGEIYRGSLAGVSSGQWDAGLASGFSFFGVLKYIVLPQAFRISVPALSNVASILKPFHVKCKSKICSEVENMKTPLTIEIESSLYQYCIEQGGLVVEEVTMPDDQGIVDTLSCLTKFDGSREWRCYELKVTKADFRSTAKLSFVGHYNYFVLPSKLYEEVKTEIPTGIGVLVYRPYTVEEEMPASGTFLIAKKAAKKELAVPEEALTNRFMASLFREVRKAKQMERGVKYFPTDQLYKELKRRSENQDPFSNERYYERFLEEIASQAINELQEEVIALQHDYEYLRQQQQIRRLPTEPLE